jgi:hypothetical protein
MIGLYFEVSKPIVLGGDYLFTIRNLDSYGHTINAVGGFWSANLGISVLQSVAEDWYESGLGRQIHVKNQFNRTVWRGFVNSITVTAGSQTVSRGPLLDIANRASCIYTPRFFNPGAPPVDGTTQPTPLADDTVSQAQYGIIEKSTAGGTCPDDIAIKIRDVYIEQNKLPKATGDFSISGEGQTLGLSLELLGNVHWLTVYPFNNLVEGIITPYDKLLQVLNANTTINPGTISTDYFYIEDNVYPPVDQLEDKDRYALDIIQEILTFGNDVNDLRRLFGVYEDNLVHYNTMPTTIGYEYKLSWQKQRVIDYNSRAFVYPWDIRPGKWIFVSDWLIGREKAVPIYEDKRCKFVESVSFSAPYTVGLQGSPYDTLAQMLAKITYTGGIY